MYFRSKPHRATTFVVCFISLLAVVLPVIAQSGSVSQQLHAPSAGLESVRRAQQSAGQSSVTGRVVYSDNGQVLKGVTVEIIRAGTDNRLSTRTNERGGFQFDGLGVGKYYLSVRGLGVAALSGFGMKLPLPINAIPRAEDYPEIVPRHDASVELDGTKTATVVVRIVRGGSITGKVLNNNGSPAPNVAVNLLSRDNNTGPYTARLSAVTDQKGVYKIESVPPGDYIVSAATEDKRPAYDVRARLRGENQVVTFHPAAERLSDASTVRIDSGRESGSVNITLVERRMLNVSGKLIAGRDGEPIGGARVVLRSKDTEQMGPLVPGMAQRTTVTSSDGTWSFHNLSAGEYEVSALVPIGAGPVTELRSPPAQNGPPSLGSRGTGPVGPRPRFSIVQEEIKLLSADVEDLVLTMRGTGRLRGTVATETGEPLPQALTLFFEFVTGNRPGRPEPVRVALDGSFLLDGVPAGNRPIAVALQSGSEYYVSLAMMGGEDLRNGASIVEDTEGAPVRVELSKRFATVSGRVNSADSGLQSAVLFIPFESSKRRFRTLQVAILTASDGSFSARIPPGEYLVIARRPDQLSALAADLVIDSVNALPRVRLEPDQHKEIQLNRP